MATFLSLSGSIISIFSHSILIKLHHQCTSDGVPGSHTFELPFFLVWIMYRVGGWRSNVVQHSSLLNDCSFNGGNQFNFFLSLIVACHHFIFFSWSMCLCDPFSTRGIKEQFSYVCHLFFFLLLLFASK